MSVIRVKPTPVAATAAPAPLKEDEFPCLSKTPMALAINSAYSTQTKKKSSFQEEDFPALVTKAQPLKPAACSRSAWSKNTPLNKPSPQAPSSSKPAPPFSSDPLLSTSSSSMKKKGGKSKKAPPSPLSSDEEGKGLTQQEVRSVPTMLDISSLLTVKGGNRKSPTTSSPPNQSPNLDPPFISVGKKKRRHKNNAAAPAGMVVPGVTENPISVETVAQKENVPEKPWNKLLFNAGTETVTNGVDSSHPEKSSTPPLEAVEISQPTSEPELIQEEDEFPALTSKNPPPGTYLHDNLQLVLTHILAKLCFFPLKAAAAYCVFVSQGSRAPSQQKPPICPHLRLDWASKPLNHLQGSPESLSTVT